MKISLHQQNNRVANRSPTQILKSPVVLSVEAFSSSDFKGSHHLRSQQKEKSRKDNTKEPPYEFNGLNSNYSPWYPPNWMNVS